MGTHPIIESPYYKKNTMVKLEKCHKCPKNVSVEAFNKYNAYIESANKLLNKVYSEKVMGELFKLINDTFSTFIRFSYDVRDDGSITIESENIAPQHPILHNAWERFIISGYGRVNNTNISFACVPNTPIFSMFLLYFYVPHEGGYNSTKIGRVSYTENDGWKIETTQEQV